jgi:predicted transcriptional regulator
MPGPIIDPIKAAQAMELNEVGYSSVAIGERVGINPSTVRDIVAKHGRWGEIADRPVFMELRQQQKAILHTATLAVCAKALVRVDETIDNASAYQAAGIYGLLRTHDRLDAGESTHNIEVHTKLEVEGLDKLSDLLSQRLLSNDVSEPSK